MNPDWKKTAEQKESRGNRRKINERIWMNVMTLCNDQLEWGDAHVEQPHGCELLRRTDAQTQKFRNATRDVVRDQCMDGLCNPKTGKL